MITVNAAIASAVLAQMAERQMASVRRISLILRLLPTHRLIGERGVEIERPAMRKMPGGNFFSEDVADFFNRFVAGGYARAMDDDTAVFSPYALILCRQILISDFRGNPGEIRTLIHIMKS